MKKKSKKGLACRVAGNVAQMFAGNGPIPLVKEKGNGKWETVDVRTGKVIARSSSPNLPDGTPMQIFKSYPVRLLKKVRTDDGWESKGSTNCSVSMSPGGSVDLGYFNDVGSGTVINSSPVEGVDFEFV